MIQLECEEAARRLHTFLDRELMDAEITEVQMHLENCEECLSKFRFEASFKRLVREQASTQAAPTELRDWLGNRLRQRSSECSSRDDR